MVYASSNKRFLTLLLLTVSLISLTSCGKKERESVHYNSNRDRPLYLTAGDTFRMDHSMLAHIPEGHSADEYVWSSTYVACDVQSDGTVNAKKSGNCIIQAKLELKDLVYVENFDVIVRPQRAVFKLEPEEITIFIDDNGMYDIAGTGHASVELIIDEPLAYHETIEWSSSDPGIVSVNSGSAGLSRGGTKASVKGVGEGSGEIFASDGNNTASVRVTVHQNYADAGRILEVLGERADNDLVVSGKTAFISGEDVGCTMIPEGEPGDGGKYLVQVERDMKGNTSGTFYSARTDPAVYQIGYTSLLPKEKRAGSMAEVSYYIRVSEEEPVKGPWYTNGVQGWYRRVDICLVDAVTGEVLETYDSIRGRLEDEYHLPESAKNVYSPLPEMSRVYSSLRRVIADLWFGDYDNVVFYDHEGKGEKVNGKSGPSGIRAYSCYGKGVVQFPDGLGFIVLAKHDKGDITGFDLSSNMELDDGDWWGWKANFRLRVPAGSETEKFLQKHNIEYEGIE